MTTCKPTIGRPRRGKASLGVALLAGTSMLIGVPIQGAAQDLTVLGLEVHLNNMRALGFAEGGVDNLADFEESTGASVNYITGTVTSLQESLQRLGVLNNTTEDVIYVNQLDANSRVTTFLSPLSPEFTERSVEGFPQDWPPGVLASSTFNDELYLLPLRCGTFTLWYNTQIFEDLGIEGPPKTPEQLLEIARAGTFTRESGEQVFGFATRGDKWSLTEDMTVMARVFGGDLITQDLEVVINQPPAVAAVRLMQQMYEEGLMPPNWASIDGSAVQQLIRDERLTMSTGGANWGPQFAATHAVPAHMPLIEELWTDEIDYSPSVIWYWGVGILSGASDRELAYDFIEHIAQPQVQYELTRNGNGPCTTSVLAEFAEADPGMKLTQEIFAISRPPIPAHPNMNQVRDLMGEAIQDIVVNGLDVQTELDRVAERMTRLLAQAS